MRIREFDSSWGRFELYDTLVHSELFYASRCYNLLQSLIECKGVRPVRLKEQRKIIIIFEHEKSKKSEIYLNETFET